MNPIRKTIAGTAMVAAALGGGAIGASLVTAANAQDATTSTATTDSSSSTATPSTETPSTQSAPPPGAFDPTRGGHVGANGTKEQLLTGDTAEQVKAAALKAVEGGTIQRVETDAEGATYEAHMLDADGRPVTVKLDASFNVTSTEDGPDGHGGHGGPGAPDAADTQSSQSTQQG